MITPTRNPEPHRKIEAWLSDAERILEPYVSRGQTEGRYTIYYTGGAKLLLAEWRRGRPHGRTQTWYLDGRPMHEIHFCDGAFHGSWRKWGPNGELLIAANYDHGNLIEWVELDAQIQMYRHFEPGQEPGMAGKSC